MLTPDKPGPVTASGLNTRLLKTRGRDTWVPVTATVCSCDYTTKPGNDKVGHYRVIYSYSVDGSIYTGHFADYGLADETGWKRDDTLEVRYDPTKPEESYYPDLRTDHQFRFASALVGGGVGLLVMAIYWLSHHLHRS